MYISVLRDHRIHDCFHILLYIEFLGLAAFLYLKQLLCRTLQPEIWTMKSSLMMMYQVHHHSVDPVVKLNKIWRKVPLQR